MTDKGIRVVLFCCDGLFQRDLMQRLNDAYTLEAIVLQIDRASRRSAIERIFPYTNPRRLLRYASVRLNRPAYQRQAQPLIERILYRNGKPPDIPSGVEVHCVENINDAATLEVLDRIRPDAVAVNGTRLIREPLLGRANALRLGMINLHTGLSPYSRGGNCNLFMLLEDHPELVGITIHHINSGIDSGDIVITARPNLSPDDTIETIDAKSFELGNRAMISALKQIHDGRAERVQAVDRWQGVLASNRLPIRSLPARHGQSEAGGRTY